MLSGVGVSVALLRQFQKQHSSCSTTTRQIATTVRKITIEHACSYVDYLLLELHTSQQGPDVIQSNSLVGPVTHFVSHAWDANFDDFVLSLEENPTFNHQNGSTFFWIDIFCVNQHISQGPMDWWDTKGLDSLLSNTKATVVVLYPASRPMALSRCWCLWEILSTIRLGGSVTFISTSVQYTQFLDFICSSSFQVIRDQFLTVSCLTAECSMAKDQTLLQMMMVQTYSNLQQPSELVSRAVSRFIEVCLRHAIQAGLLEPSERPLAVSHLAHVLAHQGRVADAKATAREAITLCCEGHVDCNEVASLLANLLAPVDCVTPGSSRLSGSAHEHQYSHHLHQQVQRSSSLQSPVVKVSSSGDMTDMLKAGLRSLFLPFEDAPQV